MNSVNFADQEPENEADDNTETPDRTDRTKKSGASEDKSPDAITADATVTPILKQKSAPTATRLPKTPQVLAAEKESREATRQARAKKLKQGQVPDREKYAMATNKVLERTLPADPSGQAEQAFKASEIDLFSMEAKCRHFILDLVNPLVKQMDGER